METAAVERMREHLLASFPEEGCGFVVAPLAGGIVDEVIGTLNVHDPPRSSRFAIDPALLAHTEDELARTGRAIVGIFHSHTGSPAEPSATDLAGAWPGYRYLIQDLRGGRVGELRCWVLAADRLSFEPVPFQIAEE